MTTVLKSYLLLYSELTNIDSLCWSLINFKIVIINPLIIHNWKDNENIIEICPSENVKNNIHKVYWFTHNVKQVLNRFLSFYTVYNKNFLKLSWLSSLYELIIIFSNAIMQKMRFSDMTNIMALLLRKHNLKLKLNTNKKQKNEIKQFICNQKSNNSDKLVVAFWCF